MGSQYVGWFDRGLVPDGEDPYLEQAIKEGIVPELCLQGGVPIWKFHNEGIDICQLCPWPRSLCGGRPQRKDGVIETKYDADLSVPDHSNAGTKQMRLRLWKDRLEQQIKEKEDE